MAPKAGSAVQVLSPADQITITNTIRQATMLAGLSPWERHKIEVKIKRQRGQLIVQLAEIEAQTVLAEATITAQGRVDEARARQALRTIAMQLRCLVEAGRLRDDTVAEAVGLSAGSSEVVADAANRILDGYARGLEARAELSC